MPLALFFLDRFNRKFGREVGPFTPEAALALEAAPWPGNVRQLEHVVERVVAVKSDGLVGTADLGSLAIAPSAPVGALAFYRDARDGFDRDYFTRLMTEAGGNVSEAARLSGLARQNLYPHLKRHGLITET
jgi:DNA-binding NtrC family response regulator